MSRLLRSSSPKHEEAPAVARNTTQDRMTRSNNNEDTMGQRGWRAAATRVGIGPMAVHPHKWYVFTF